MAFHLHTCDILVDVNRETDLFSRIMKWALGSDYTHVGMYLGPVIQGKPTIYESIGRGVIIRNHVPSLGKEYVVMRYGDRAPWQDAVVTQAIEIAFDPKSFYDYLCIGSITLTLLLQKMKLPVPLKYQRNAMMICSEAVAEPYWRAGFDIVSKERVPLPQDFIYSSNLQMENRGIFSEDWL